MADVLCCTQAVYQYGAGWWCPQHGDQMQIALEETGEGDITEADHG